MSRQQNQTENSTDRSNEFLGWSADRWIAFAALFVAALALVVSVCELRDARRHERISAQPHLTYTYFYNDEGAGWKIKNSGLGTARLRGFRILVDGKPVRDFNDLGKALGLPQPVPFRFTNPMVGVRYAAGHENILYWVQPSAAAMTLLKQWTRVNIQACYCSLYGDCWLFSFDGKLNSPDGEHRRDNKCSIFSSEEKNRWWQG